MDTEEKTIAVVSHPGNGAQEVVTTLQGMGLDKLHWLSVPEVHMLGRNTADERTTYDYLLGKTDKGASHRPDGILALISAQELTRQLYLASQLIDLRLPMAIGYVHMVDANREGLFVDVEKIGAQLGVPCYELNLDNGESAEQIAQAMIEALNDSDKKKPLHWRPTMALADAYHLLDKKWIYKHLKLHSGARLIEGLRLLGVAKAVEEYDGHPAQNELVGLVDEARALLESRNENWTMAEVLQRNGWINQIVASSTNREDRPPKETKPFWKKILGG